MDRKNKILEGQGKVRELYFESGKIDSLKKSQGKLKLKKHFRSLWSQQHFSFGSRGWRLLLYLTLIYLVREILLLSAEKSGKFENWCLWQPQSLMFIILTHCKFSWDIISLPCVLFISMTGVGGRPEVIIEGSNDLDGPWMVQFWFFSFSFTSYGPIWRPNICSIYKSTRPNESYVMAIIKMSQDLKAIPGKRVRIALGFTAE